MISLVLLWRWLTTFQRRFDDMLYGEFPSNRKLNLDEGERIVVIVVVQIEFAIIGD